MAHHLVSGHTNLGVDRILLIPGPRVPRVPLFGRQGSHSLLLVLSVANIRQLVDLNLAILGLDRISTTLSLGYATDDADSSDEQDQEANNGVKHEVVQAEYLVIIVVCCDVSVQNCFPKLSEHVLTKAVVVFRHGWHDRGDTIVPVIAEADIGGEAWVIQGGLLTGLGHP